MSFAFVTTPLLTSSSFVGSAFPTSVHKTSTSYNVALPSTHTRPCMKVDLKPEQEQKFKKAKDSQNALKDAMKEGGRGWTDYAERLNGRVAMMAFMLGLVTEIIAPNHPTMVEQVAALFQPLSNLF